VEQETIQQLITYLKQVVSSRIQRINFEIASKRKIAKQRREDKIAKLSEALRIASALKQHEQIPQQDTANPQLYLRGSNVLQIEIDTLKKRKSDDPFITGLRDLQEELITLQAIKVDKTKLRVVTVDQQAYPPKYRIKPNRKLIVIMGFLSGLMLGIFAAFFINFIKNQKVELAPVNSNNEP